MDIKLRKEEIAKKLMEFAQLFRAYKECSDNMQQHADAMLAAMADEESDHDDRMLAALTLADILFPDISKIDNMLGVDLEEDERATLETSQAARETAKRMDEEEASFATNLQRTMEAKRMTQVDLAKKLGLRQSAISMMLQRNCRPQKKTVIRMAEALGVEPSDLWPGI